MNKQEFAKQVNAYMGRFLSESEPPNDLDQLEGAWWDQFDEYVRTVASAE